jgi:uncharacterized Zn finger protein (UPF0148 family)
MSRNLLEDIIKQFTNKYILCPQCTIPEWNGKYCQACGFSIVVLNEKKKKKNIGENLKNDKKDYEIETVKYIKFFGELKSQLKSDKETKQVDDMIDKLWKISCEKDFEDCLHEIDRLKKSLELKNHHFI